MRFMELQMRKFYLGRMIASVNSSGRLYLNFLSAFVNSPCVNFKYCYLLFAICKIWPVVFSKFQFSCTNTRAFAIITFSRRQKFYKFLLKD